jgi:hypothetical protein
VHPFVGVEVADARASARSLRTASRCTCTCLCQMGGNHLSTKMVTLSIQLLLYVTMVGYAPHPEHLDWRNKCRGADGLAGSGAAFLARSFSGSIANEHHAANPCTHGAACIAGQR